MLRPIGFLVGLAVALAAIPAASADGGSVNYTSKLNSVDPAIKGLLVRVVDGDDAIELRNATGYNVTVAGYENEPYLRFLVNGRVEVNVNSPAKYLNEDRFAAVTVPKTASASAKPRWQLVAQAGTYTWHEHRVHWMSTDRPPQVKASGGHEVQRVFNWVVPLGVGGKRVKARGTLWWVPTGQAARAEALIAAAVAEEARQKAVAAQKRADDADEQASQSQTPGEAVAPAAAPQSQPTSASGSPVLWVVIGALAVALVGVAAYALRLRRRDDPARPAGEVW
jgi:hypothetical protein